MNTLSTTNEGEQAFNGNSRGVGLREAMGMQSKYARIGACVTPGASVDTFFYGGWYGAIVSTRRRPPSPPIIVDQGLLSELLC